MNLREQILTADDFTSEVVEMPEWGNAKIKVKSISEGTRRRLLKDCSDEKGNLDMERFSPALLIASLHDPLNDKPVFQPEDRDALAAKSSKAVEKIIAVAMRVCGFTTEAVTEKNSEKTEA